jgi:DNA-binding transcriptional LysR family regulator
VVYEPRRALDLDRLAAQGIQRRFAVMVPGFAGLPPFIRGSELLATVPARLQSHLLRDLASVEPPVPCPPMPMYMVWHRGTRWMRRTGGCGPRWRRWWATWWRDCPGARVHAATGRACRASLIGR